MKRWTFLLLAVTVALPPTAGAVDKSQSTLVNPGVSSPASPIPLAAHPLGFSWTNGTSKGKTKGDAKCKVQMLLKGLALPDSDGIPGTGDEVICVSDTKLNLGGAPLDTTSVFRGEVKNGVVKIKVDLVAEGIPCTPSGTGGPPTASYEARTICFEPDPGYPAPPLGFSSDPTQGVYPVSYGPHPASPVIATNGIYFAP